jgi:tetratricopeptide (TPR) repeat protein
MGSSEEPPDPADVRTAEELRAAMIRLAGSRRKITTIARETGLASSSVSELFAGKRRVTRRALGAIVGAYAPGDWERWTDAWARVAAATPGGRRSTVPRELPVAPAFIVGRNRELAELDRLLDPAPANPAPVVAIVGMPGSGKTALALHWAARHEHRFADGSFFVDLRGYDAGEPMSPEAAVAALLRALGTDDADQPNDLDGRTALYRTLLSDREVIIVLDNAHDTEQVRPLLPGPTHSQVLVTARDSLAALRDLHGARRVTLAPLSKESAAELITSLLGDDTVDPSVVDAVARHCGRLPLALRIAAGVALDTHGGLQAVAAQLADDEQRLDILDSGDSRAAVRTVVSWSFRHLDEATSGLFRLMGVCPASDVDEYIAAALVDAAAGQARRWLQRLARAGLIHELGPGRMVMHDLLRDYARDAYRELDRPSRGHAAFARLRSYYLHGAYRVRKQLGPGTAMAPSTLDVPDMRPLADAATATAWFREELPGILAMVPVAVAADDHPWVARIADAIWWPLLASGRHADAVTLYEQACHCAAQWGRLDWEARSLEHLALAEQFLGRYDDALLHAGNSLNIGREIDDRAQQARALTVLGTTYTRRGAHEEAVARLREVLDLAADMGDPALEARTWNNLGLTYQRWGRLREAVEPLDNAIEQAERLGVVHLRAIALNNRSLVLRKLSEVPQARADIETAHRLAVSLGDRSLQAEVLDSQGSLLLEDGEPQAALGILEDALAMHRDMADRAAEAETLDNLGACLQRLGRSGDAMDMHLTAVDLAARIGDRERVLSASLGCARVQHAQGDTQAALQYYMDARDLASELDNAEQQAHALHGLAVLWSEMGAIGRAISAGAEALALFERLGLPDADMVTRRLRAWGADLPQ